MPTANIGLGATLSVDKTTPGTLVPFTLVKEIGVPKPDLEYVDSSYLGMGDRYRQYVAGLIGPGDLTFTLQWNKADYATCIALQAVKHHWEIAFPDTSTVAFDGILQNAETKIVADQIMEIACSVRVVGAVTFTPAS